MPEAQVTTDYVRIRQWAEACGGRPASGDGSVSRSHALVERD